MRSATIASLGIVLALFLIIGLPSARAQEVSPAALDDAQRLVVFESFTVEGAT